MRRLANAALCLGTLLCTLTLFTGCDEAPAGGSTATVASKTNAPPPPPPPPGPPSRDEDTEGYEAEATEGSPHEEHAAADEELEPHGERIIAEAGVGKRGRNYGGGVITEPIKQYFGARQRIHFINMTHAMRLYKAEFGYPPKSQEEFMEKIIKANGIELPELPEGQKYVYVPSQGELMVEKPR